MPELLQQRLARRRRLSLLDPASGLFRTHVWDDGDTIDTTNQHPDRDIPMCWAVRFSIDGVSPNGLLFELGGSTGVALWLDSTGPNIGFTAGLETGDDGVAATSSIDITSGRVYNVVAALNGDGTIRVWLDGMLRIAAQAAAGSWPSGWSGPAAGLVGGFTGAVTDRVPAGAQVVLADASILGQLSCFSGQRPQHYYNPGKLA